MNPLFDSFRSHAINRPDHPALHAESRSLTRSELLALAHQVADALSTNGVEAGDRVMIHTQSSIASVATALGVAALGAVVTTLHHSFDRRKLLLQLADSGARVLMTDRVTADDDLPEASSLGWILGTDLRCRAGGGGNTAPKAVGAGAIFYTSGSSGQPKGVLVDHANMLAAFKSVSGLFGYKPDDVVLSYSSVTSDYGYYNVLMPLCAGAASVLEPGAPEDPLDIMAAIWKYRVTNPASVSPSSRMLPATRTDESPSSQVSS